MKSGPGRLPRLPGFDYASPGFYFLTFTTWQWQQLFGYVTSQGLILGPFGQIVREEWVKSFEIRPGLIRDAFVVMPDHFHALVGLSQEPPPIKSLVGLNRRARSISSLIGCFKASCTRRINELRGTPRAPVWRTRFYDHIVRDERALRAIRRYIEHNPRKLLSRSGFDSDNVVSNRGAAAQLCGGTEKREDLRV